MVVELEFSCPRGQPDGESALAALQKFQLCRIVVGRGTPPGVHPLPKPAVETQSPLLKPKLAEWNIVSLPLFHNPDQDFYASKDFPMSALGGCGNPSPSVF